MMATNEKSSIFMEEAEREKFETAYAMKIHKFSEINFRKLFKSHCIILKRNFGKCYLNIYEKCNDSKEYFMYFTLSVHRNKEKSPFMNDIDLKFHMHNTEGKNLFRAKKQVNYQNFSYIEEIIPLADIRSDILKKNIINDVLILEITIIQNYMFTIDITFIIAASKTVTDDLSKLYYTNELTNVAVKIKGNDFIARKLILITRSEALKEMFYTKMMKETGNLVEIKNIAPEAFTELSRYIRLDKVQKKAMELCVAADKYGVDANRRLCKEELRNYINIENAIKLFHYANSLNDEGLKEVSVAFIVDNSIKFSDADCKLLCKNRGFIQQLLKISFK